MPSVSVTNAFDITTLDIDVNLTLSGFGSACDGTYEKTGLKTWNLPAGNREIVYLESDDSPGGATPSRARWVIRVVNAPSTLHFGESVTSAADHPLGVSWSNLGGGSIGTIAIQNNQDVGGSANINDFTNLTSLHFAQVGLTEIKGDIYNKNLTYINLSGNSIPQRFLGFKNDSLVTEFLVSDNSFAGVLPYVPKTAKFINVSNNDFFGQLPSLTGNSVIEKFVGDRNDSPLPDPFDCFTGYIPSMEGCNSITHFSISGNSVIAVDSSFQVPASILYFDVSYNDLHITSIRKILKAFNETFFEASPQIDVTGEGRTINISSNQDFIDNSPGDSQTLTYISNLEGLGWSVIR